MGRMLLGRRLWAGVMGCALLLGAGALQAGEVVGRLTVEIRIDGAYSWQAGSDHANGRTTERYRVVTHVKSDGVPDSVNVMDPDYARKQVAKAAAVQRKVAQAQGRPPVETPATPGEQQALMERMQREQAACGGDQQCLYALAMKYMPVMNAMAMQSIAGSQQSGAEDVDLDAKEEARFLSFFGYDGCPTQMEVSIRRHSEGAYADVGGMVPWSESLTADSRGSEADRRMQCLNQQTVYDLQERRIHMHGFAPPIPRGRRVIKDRLHGETASDDAEIPAMSEALTWVSDQLRNAPASGTRTTTLAPERARGGVVTAGARTSGEIKVSLDWKFEPDVQVK